MLLRSCVTAFAVLILGSLPTAAQEASIVGTAADESKALLPGVTITASDLATGRTFVAVTSDRGEFRLLGLPAGRYKVQAVLTEFTTATIPEEELLASQNAAIAFTLKVSSLRDSVTVVGKMPLVTMRSAEIAGNVDPARWSS